MNQVIHGDSLYELKKLDDNSIDSIVTDPPYELGFMGKEWDRTGISNNVELWEEVLRVLKPGGHLLAFGGTRTYHRMASAIEDAGFEIRDQLQWLTGQGFPKSMNISKAIDKQAGAEREVTGVVRTRDLSRHGGEIKGDMLVGKSRGSADVEVKDKPVTEGAKQWDGWGTALKPAFEPVVWATKTLTTVPKVGIMNQIQKVLELILCQMFDAKFVERYSELNPRDSNEGMSDFVQWAVEKSLTKLSDDEFGRTGMFKSPGTARTFLSIVWLWNVILAGNSKATNTSTTSTATSKTTALKTLKSSVLGSISRSITLLPECQVGGLLAFAKDAERLSSERSSKLKGIPRHSVPESAILTIGKNVVRELALFVELNFNLQTLKENTARLNVTGSRESESEEGEKQSLAHIVERSLRPLKQETPNIADALAWRRLSPNAEPIVLARKPVSEKTIAENVLKWGTGGLNIDGCRVGWKDEKDRKNGWRASPSNDDENEYSSFKSGSFGKQNEQGRFPANVILDEEAGCMLDEQQGNASRFFYVAKASKRERTHDGQVENNHPTVKPIRLMEYLIKMVTPPGGIVLDPFGGSGTTALAATNLGFKYIIIEKEKENVDIINQRIKHNH